MSHASKPVCEEIVSFMPLHCAVRLVAEIQSLEALDVFGMLKETSLNSLAALLTDRKVNILLLLLLLLLLMIFV